MEAKAGPDGLGDLSLSSHHHRPRLQLPAVPVPLSLASLTPPGPLQFVSCAAAAVNAASKMNSHESAAPEVKQEAFCIRWKGFQVRVIATSRLKHQHGLDYSDQARSIA